MRTRTILVGVAALSLVFVACGKDKADNASPARTTAKAAPKPAVLKTTLAAYGDVLTDGDGRTLYFFDKDATTKPASACSGQCATNWPALTTSDGAGVGDGLDASLLSQNDAKQYTYNGWPLYRFIGDKAAGDTNGQGVGGVWHIAGADGNPVMTAATSATTAAPAAAKKTVTTKASTAATNPPATQPPATQPPATSPATSATTAYVYPY